jgi:hypothetical protein
MESINRENGVRLKIMVDYEFLTTTDLTEILRCVRMPFTRAYRRHRDFLHIEVIETKKSVLIDVVIVEILKYLGMRATEEVGKILWKKIKKTFEESGVHRRQNINHISIAIFVDGKEVEIVKLPNERR